MNVMIDCYDDPETIFEVLTYIGQTTEMRWASGQKPTEHAVRRGYLFIRTDRGVSEITYGPCPSEEIPMLTAEEFMRRNHLFKRF